MAFQCNRIWICVPLKIVVPQAPPSPTPEEKERQRLYWVEEKRRKKEKQLLRNEFDRQMATLGVKGVCREDLFFVWKRYTDHSPMTHEWVRDMLVDPRHWVQYSVEHIPDTIRPAGLKTMEEKRAYERARIIPIFNAHRNAMEKLKELMWHAEYNGKVFWRQQLKRKPASCSASSV